MAYTSKKINILDLKPSTGIGVAIPFYTPQVFQSVFTTKEQIKYNLINFILTDTGERIFEPRFGLGLRKKVFEQLSDNTLTSIEEYFKSGIENYFTNIEIIDFKINANPDINTLTISFSYIIISTNENDSITINLENE